MKKNVFLGKQIKKKHQILANLYDLSDQIKIEKDGRTQKKIMTAKNIIKFIKMTN